MGVLATEGINGVEGDRTCIAGGDIKSDAPTSSSSSKSDLDDGMPALLGRPSCGVGVVDAGREEMSRGFACRSGSSMGGAKVLMNELDTSDRSVDARLVPFAKLLVR